MKGLSKLLAGFKQINLKVALQIFGQKFYKILKNHPNTPKAF